MPTININALSTETVERTDAQKLSLVIEGIRGVALGANLADADLKGILRVYASRLERERKALVEEILALEAEDGYLPSFGVRVELQIGTNGLQFDEPEDYDEMVSKAQEKVAPEPVESGMRIVDDNDTGEFFPAFKRTIVISQFEDQNGERIEYLVNVANVSKAEQIKYEPYYRGMLAAGKTQEVRSVVTQAKVVRYEGDAPRRARRVL